MKKNILSLIILAGCELSPSKQSAIHPIVSTTSVTTSSSVVTLKNTPVILDDPKDHEDNKNKICTVEQLDGVCEDLNYTSASPIK